MKIGIMGTCCVGKTTFIKDFITNWPMYNLCKKPRYTQQAAENDKIKLNEDGNEESQKIILDSLVDQVMYTPKGSNVLFDRSVLDNLVYTMWMNAKGKVSDEFVKSTIKIVKESLVFYDILFFLPITKQSPVVFEPRVDRSEDAEYRIEVDYIFKALVYQYTKGNRTYFPFDHKDGCGAIIEVYGNRAERIQLAKMYINEFGNSYGEDESLLTLTPEELETKQLIESLTNPIQIKNKNIIAVTKK